MIACSPARSGNDPGSSSSHACVGIQDHAWAVPLNALSGATGNPMMISLDEGGYEQVGTGHDGQSPEEGTELLLGAEPRVEVDVPADSSDATNVVVLVHETRIGSDARRSEE